MRMSWKALATTEEAADAMERTKQPQVQQRIRAVSPPPASCSSGARAGAMSPPPKPATCLAGGLVGSLAAKVGPALQAARPMVKPPPEPVGSGSEDTDALRKKEMEQEIEKSLMKAIDMLQKTKLQEGSQSLPEEQQAVFAAFKKELENQQATLAEVVKQQLRSCDFERRTEAAVEKLRGDFDTAQQLQAMEYASIRVEWEQHRAQWSALEAAVSKMQEEVSMQVSQSNQVEGMVRDIRGNVDTLREDVMRSTGSLGRVVEDVSAAVAATERSLRREMEETRLALEAANSQQRAELRQDQEAIRVIFDKLYKDVAQLKATVSDERSANANAVGKAEHASHCVQEVMATAGDRLGRLESSLRRLEAAEAKRAAADGGPESGAATAQDVSDIWDVLNMLKASLEARESAVRAEADVQSLEAENIHDGGYSLASRLAALEEQSRSQRASSSRVGALVESLEQLLGECAAVGRGGDPDGWRSEASTMQVCIATPTGLGAQACRTPTLSTSGSVKGELLRTVKACASAAMSTDRDHTADPFCTPDLTPAVVAMLPTPQAPGACPVSPAGREHIRV